MAVGAAKEFIASAVHAGASRHLLTALACGLHRVYLGDSHAQDKLDLLHQAEDIKVVAQQCLGGSVGISKLRDTLKSQGDSNLAKEVAAGNKSRRKVAHECSLAMRVQQALAPAGVGSQQQQQLQRIEDKVDLLLESRAELQSSTRSPCSDSEPDALASWYADDDAVEKAATEKAASGKAAAEKAASEKAAAEKAASEEAAAEKAAAEKAAAAAKAAAERAAAQKAATDKAAAEKAVAEKAAAEKAAPEKAADEKAAGDRSGDHSPAARNAAVEKAAVVKAAIEKAAAAKAAAEKAAAEQATAEKAARERAAYEKAAAEKAAAGKATAEKAAAEKAAAKKAAAEKAEASAEQAAAVKAAAEKAAAEKAADEKAAAEKAATEKAGAEKAAGDGSGDHRQAVRLAAHNLLEQIQCSAGEGQKIKSKTWSSLVQRLRHVFRRCAGGSGSSMQPSAITCLTWPSGL